MDHPGLAGPKLVTQHTGQVYRLTHARTTIGRQADNVIVLSDPQVSRYHAEVTRQDGSLVVRDLGSANGTYVNEQRIAKAQPLRHGDTLRVGSIILSVHLSQVAAAASPPDTQEASPATPATQVQQRSSATPIILGLVAAGLLILCLAVATILVQPFLRQDVPSVVIRSPAGGAQFTAGTEINLQATAAGASNLRRLELLVDNTLVKITSSSDPEGADSLTASGQWIASSAGTHTVSAIAYTASGKASEPASVQVIVVDLPRSPTASPPPLEPSPTPLASPTALPVPTDTPLPPTPTDLPTATDLPDTPTPSPSPTPTRTPVPSPTPTPTGLPPKIEYFRAEPEIIEYGSCTVLEWGKVLNATEASIEPGIGGVGTPDTRVVCPTETTTYTLAAIGPDGQASMSVTVMVGSALPDLTIQSVTFLPSPVIRGQDNQGQLTIYNAGDGNAGPFVWKWKAESDEVFRGRLEDGLEAGETTVISFTWRPVAAYQGLLYVAKVDVRDEVAESNDMNNRLEATIDVIDTPLGDLVLQEFSLDDGNQVMIQVANPGGRIKTPTFEYELYQDGDLVLSGSLETPDIGHRVYATGHVITDEHEIRVVIDPADLIPESDESNNEGTLTCSSASRSCS